MLFLTVIFLLESLHHSHKKVAVPIQLITTKRISVIVFGRVFLPFFPSFSSLDVMGRPLSQAAQWADTSSIGRRSTFRTNFQTALLIDSVTREVSGELRR